MAELAVSSQIPLCDLVLHWIRKQKKSKHFSIGQPDVLSSDRRLPIGAGVAASLRGVVWRVGAPDAMTPRRRNRRRVAPGAGGQAGHWSKVIPGRLFPDGADLVGHLRAVLEHVQPTVIALM